MNRASLLVLTLALLGAAPTPAPLVTGTVRDQHGAPIEGARVRIFSGSRAVATVQTDAAGTFSAVGTAESVHIECLYCRPSDALVAADGTAVAVVQRYDALLAQTPSAEDLAHLPYSRIESDIALTPFVVLNQTARTIPGSSLSDRNAYPGTGLILLNGVPDYDIVANQTPLDTIPSYSGTSVNVARVDDAYAYGDLANAGTFEIATTGGTSAAFAGSNTGVRASTSANSASDASLAWSNWDDGDRRARADLALPFTVENSTGSFALSSGNGTVAYPGHAAYESSFSSARASLAHSGSIDTLVTAIADRGTYAYEPHVATSSSEWSDLDVSVGARAHTVVAPFLLIEARSSSGSNEAGPFPNLSMAATLQQLRGVAGVDISQPGYDAEFTLGTDDARFINGYRSGYANETSGSASSPSASGSLDIKLAPQWTLQAGANRGTVLQSFFGYIGNNGLTPVDAVSLDEATLNFDDRQRVRASLTTLASRDQYGNATSSAGASVGWQIAPALSVRAWLMQARSTAQQPQTVGSAWLTYQTSGLRIDAIWQRDLLDQLPDAHLDASIGGALGHGVAWFVASERLQNVRATTVGIRF